MKVLGFDPSSECIGVASIEGDAFVAWTFRPKGASIDEKCVAIRQFALATIIAEAPDFVGIEAPAEAFAQGRTNANAIHVVARVNGVIGEVCAELGVPYERVPPSTHRKAFLGRGTFPAGEAKDATIAHCRSIGMTIKSKDAADATSVAFWAAGRARVSVVKPGDLFSTHAAE